MESFGTIVNGFWPLTLVVKLSILDVCGGPGNASRKMRETKIQAVMKTDRQSLKFNKD